MDPFSLLETDGSEEKTADLVCEYAEPDPFDSHSEHVAEQIRGEGPDHRDADRGGAGGIEGVSGAAEASHVDDLCDLEQHGKYDDIHDVNTVSDDRVFTREKGGKQRFCTEEIDERKTDGKAAADDAAGFSVFFCPIRVFCSEGKANQRHGGGLQSVPEGERQSHDIHGDLMGGHGFGPLCGRHDGGGHEADTHQKLLKKDTVADAYEIFERGSRGKDFFGQHIGDADIVVLRKYG